MSKFFISHSSADRPFVEMELLGLFRALGLNVWFAEDDIQTAEKKINDAIDGDYRNIYLADEVPYGINAAEFYLQDQYIAPLAIADYVISADEFYGQDNLTPGNRVMFLFKRNQD